MLRHHHTMQSYPYTNKPALCLSPVTKSVLMAATLAVVVGNTVPSAVAADNESRQVNETTQARRFSIPAGTLDQVLNHYARETSIMLVIDASLTAGKTSKGLQGSYGVRQGLAAILQGNQLEATMQDNGSYALKKMVIPPVAILPAAKASPDTLPEIAVKAHTEQETAAGPVKGYVAKRVSSGTKTDSAILENPQSISVITRDELDMRNVQRDGDALRYTAGVISENYGNDTRPTYDVGSIRGFDPSTTGMYRDGLRETNGLWSRVLTDIKSIERIEVLKGPSSVLYGQSEPAGVINKVTKKPSEVAIREIELQVGNYDRYQGSFDVGGPIDEDGKVLYRVIGLARDSESQYKYNNSHRSKDDRELFAPSITFKPSDKTSLTLQAEYLHTKVGVPFTVGTATNTSKVMIGDYTYDKNERKQYTAGYLFEHQFNDTWTVRQNFRASKVDFQYARMGNFSQLGSVISRGKSYLDEQLDGLAIDNQLQAKFNIGNVQHTVLMGLDFQRSAYVLKDGDGFVPDDTLDLNNLVYGRSIGKPAFTSKNRGALKQTGVYLQDQIKFDQHWVLTLSGRKDWAQVENTNKLIGSSTDQNDSDFTYRAGLAYVFDNGFAPYVSYSESFNPAIGRDANGNALKPTFGKQSELGVRYMPTGTRNIYTFSLFDMTQKNVTAYDAFSNVFQTGEIGSRGAELEIKTSLMDNLNLITALTYADIEITKPNGLGQKGDSPPYVPGKAASAWVDYKIPSGVLAGFGVGGGVRYVGHSDGGNPFDTSYQYTNESRTLFDAAINYSYDQHWHAAFNVNNLFDKQYITCAYGSCTYGYDRTAIATLRYSF